VNFADAEVDRVLAHAGSRPATLGSARLVCDDGPAGSGKTTLAARLAGRTGATVVHMDDLFPGWDGIRLAAPHVVALLEPLARGETGRYRRYDWLAGAYAEEHQVSPAPLLVLEGVGAGGTAWAELITTLVWVEAPRDERLRRGLERDGSAVEPQWRQWMLAEDEVFDEERTRERADLVLAT
jgi:uridine kinase